MPFTPYHLGPGALFKAIGRDRFSFLVFAGSQVLIDLEPLVRILRGDDLLHGPSHTVIGAALIGLLAGILGRPASNFALAVLRINHHAITWPVAFTSGLIGTFSHIGLDAIMHADMNPLWPLVDGNGLLGLVSTAALHVICLACAGLAGAVFAIRALLATGSGRSRS